MRIRIQVLIESDQETTPLHIEEVACFERDHLSPELLCQEVRWASLLSSGVTIKLLGDLLPMEHQLPPFWNGLQLSDRPWPAN